MSRNKFYSIKKSISKGVLYNVKAKKWSFEFNYFSLFYFIFIYFIKM